MTSSLIQRNNSASLEQLQSHLLQCDSDFRPRLSSRVSIAEYSKKLHDRAERIELWSEENLIGLIAVYANDPEKSTAFITSVSVSPSHRGKGLGQQLLDRTLTYLRQNGFKQVELEVGMANQPAVSLYESNGFKVKTQDQAHMVLTREL